jgi:hypothetical protein
LAGKKANRLFIEDGSVALAILHYRGRQNRLAQTMRQSHDIAPRFPEPACAPYDRIFCMPRLGEMWFVGLPQRILRRIERDLNALTPDGVWRVIVLSILCIAATNVLLRAGGLQVQPLYILPLCLAGWRLGLTASLWVAARQRRGGPRPVRTIGLDRPALQ